MGSVRSTTGRIRRICKLARIFVAPVAVAFAVAGCAGYPAAAPAAPAALPAAPAALTAPSPAAQTGGAEPLGRWPAGRSLAGWRPMDAARHTGGPIARAPVATRARIVAAYEGYWRATNAALDSRNPARARAIIGGFVPRGAVATLMRAFTGLWRRDEIGYGLPAFHIMKVTVTGPGNAAVHDCLDLSRLGLQNFRTGRSVGVIGQSHYNLITTLVHQRGRWLVTGSIPVVASCAY